MVRAPAIWVVALIALLIPFTLQNPLETTRARHHSLSIRKRGQPKSSCMYGPLVDSRRKFIVKLDLFKSENWRGACHGDFMRAIGNLCACTTGELPLWVLTASTEIALWFEGKAERICRLTLGIDDPACIMPALRLESQFGDNSGAVLPIDCLPTETRTSSSYDRLIETS